MNWRARFTPGAVYASRLESNERGDGVLKRPRRGRQGSVSFAGRFGLLVFYILMVIVFTLAAPDIFPTVATAQSIGQSNSVLALVALGALVPLVVGEYDLTIGAVVGIAAITFSKLHQAGIPFLPALILTAGVGVFIGCVNAFSVTVLKVSSLITTLGVGSIITGFTAYLTNGRTVTEGIPTGLTTFAQTTWLGIPRLVFVVVAVALILWFILAHTPLGRELYAVGMNRESARLMGARVNRDITLAFATSGCLAAIAGVLQLGVLQAAQPDVGAALLLPALAVAFLGASTIRPGWFNVWGTLIGVLVLQTGIVGLDDVGVPYWVVPIFNGTVLVVAVAVSTLAFAPMRVRMRRMLGRQAPDTTGATEAA
jgi:ribose transport system permease protein